MPTVLRSGPYRFFFYAGDGVEPPHVHVEHDQSTANPDPALALQVTVTDDTLTVDLVDGRTVSVPLAWFPRLAHATLAERSQWRVIGGGEGIRWSALDEDIGLDGLLAGRASGESQASLQKWLLSRKQAG